MKEEQKTAKQIVLVIIDKNFYLPFPLQAMKNVSLKLSSKRISMFWGKSDSERAQDIIKKLVNSEFFMDKSYERGLKAMYILRKGADLQYL